MAKGATTRKRGPKKRLTGERLAACDAKITARPPGKEPDEAIAAEFGMSVRWICARRAELFATVANKRDKHATERQAAEDELATIDVNYAAAAVTEQSADNLEAHLCRLIEHADRMLVSADEWLRDPANPKKYFLGPRTTEVVVDVYDHLGQRVEPGVKRTLAELLEEARAPLSALGRDVKLREAKHADPRKLLLEAVATLKPVVETLGKARGQLKDGNGSGASAAQLAILLVILRDVAGACARCGPELRQRFAAVPELPAGSGV